MGSYPHNCKITKKSIPRKRELSEFGFVLHQMSNNEESVFRDPFCNQENNCHHNCRVARMNAAQEDRMQQQFGSVLYYIRKNDQWVFQHLQMKCRLRSESTFRVNLALDRPEQSSVASLQSWSFLKYKGINRLSISKLLPYNI